MPWSWARVSTRTSPKLRNCMGDDTSAGKAEDCIRRVVEARGGRIDHVEFETNGRWAHIHFYWEDHRVKQAIVFDLEAEDVIDVLSGDDRDKLIGGDGSVT